MNYWHKIKDDIGCITELDKDKHWRNNGWRNIAIYLYGRGVVSMGDFLPNYYYCNSSRGIVHFISNKDAAGISLALNKDREIVIVNLRREILAAVGFFCEPVDLPDCFSDSKNPKSGIFLK